MPINVSDAATRMFLLTRVVASLSEAGESGLADYVRAGLTPELVDRLRNLPLADAIRFTAADCGISISIDCGALRQQLTNLERARDERSLYEYFVRGGASPQLISRLFSVAHTDVRRLRKLIAPATCTGGRPRTLQDPLRGEIVAYWRELMATEMSERHRYWALSQRFADVQIVGLESVVEEDSMARMVRQ